MSAKQLDQVQYTLYCQRLPTVLIAHETPNIREFSVAIAVADTDWIGIDLVWVRGSGSKSGVIAFKQQVVLSEGLEASPRACKALVETFYKFSVIKNLDLDLCSMNRDCSKLKLPGSKQLI